MAFAIVEDESGYMWSSRAGTMGCQVTIYLLATCKRFHRHLYADAGDKAVPIGWTNSMENLLRRKFVGERSEELSAFRAADVPRGLPSTPPNTFPKINVFHIISSILSESRLIYPKTIEIVELFFKRNTL